ncbi:MAG: hypothetical protein BWY52_02744 [Chloroflexi bacterium ADurb.Bin325]|nr:MAG: hypothetical protein BWY52_02744 [Chloroflexi bacterium ADurb.Bin325]
MPAVVVRLVVGGDEPLEVAQDDLAGRLADEVLRHDRDLAAPAGRIHHVGRDGIAGGVAAQPLDDLDALADRRAEMARARHQVALVEVVGPHPVPDQLVHQLLHHLDRIVHARQQHRLRAERDARVGQQAERAAHLGRQLPGVVEVDVQPQRVELAQQRDQLRRDALRHEDGHAAADADDLHVLDRAQPAQDVLEDLRRQDQRVAAGDQHVANLRRGRDVRDLAVVVAPAELCGRVPHDAAARAVAAVARTLRRDQHQHPIRVAVDQARHGAVAVLVERILVHAGERGQLPAGGDDLAADRAVRVVGVDQRRKIRRDVHAEMRAPTALHLVGRQVDDPAQFFEAVQPMAQLPAPIIPLGVGHVGPGRGAPRPASMGRLLSRVLLGRFLAHNLKFCCFHLVALSEAGLSLVCVVRAANETPATIDAGTRLPRRMALAAGDVSLRSQGR